MNSPRKSVMNIKIHCCPIFIGQHIQYAIVQKNEVVPEF